MDKEELKARAFEIRARYLAGKITYKEAKQQLKDYAAWYNQMAAELAAKYNQKPHKFSVGEFLRAGMIR